MEHNANISMIEKEKLYIIDDIYAMREKGLYLLYYCCGIECMDEMHDLRIKIELTLK